MAFKSPGVYFTEVDNTEYTNPAAEINTTVAIIGFAKKGPIGEPIEITSYNDFKSVFGTPIAGTYAGIGVRSVLSAGGTVLFVRIADESLASQSNVILKNSAKAQNGSLIINNKNSIVVGTTGYKNGAIYVSKITSSKYPSRSKTLLLRSPAEGRFTTVDILQQLSDGLKGTVGFTEVGPLKLTKKSTRSFFLNLVNNGENKKFGPYFVKFPDNANGETIASILNDTLSHPAASYQLFTFNSKENALYYNSDFQNFNVDSIYSDAYLDESILGAKSLDFQVKKGFNEEPVEVKVDFSVTATGDGKYTMKQLAEDINDALARQYLGISCEYVYPRSNNETMRSNNPGLLFYSIDNETFTILPSVREENGGYTFSKSLFTPVFKGEVGQTLLAKYEHNLHYDLEGEDQLLTDFIISDSELNSKTFNFLLEPKSAESKKSADELPPITVEYVKATNSLKFNINTEESTDSLTIDKPIFDSTTGLSSAFLFKCGLTEAEAIEKQSTRVEDNNTILASNSTEFSMFKEAGIATIGDGEDARDLIRVYRDDSGRINISEIGSMAAPILTDVKQDYASFDSFEDLFGEQKTEKQFELAGYKEGRDNVIIQKDGRAAESSEKGDMIIFTAKDYGSGTSDIAIEVFTSTSPIDESKTHYISLYVAGTKKEEWEDVSYDPSAENYFVNLINEAPENGGSSYVTVSVRRGRDPSGEVKVPDTAMLSSKGVVYIGKPIDDESISFRASDAESIDEYTKYDYRLGDDGRPTEDPTDLFLGAMDKETSGLANKDLYTWHILITPDDGQREDIQNAAIELCEFMEDAIYIVDPPSGLSRDGVIKWHNGGSQQRLTPLQSNYCCTYWPWGKIYNAIESKYQYVMPSVIMAAQFCKVDNNYAPWYAPAGETNGYCSTLLDLEVNKVDKRYPNKTDRDNLYLDQNRVNPFLKLRNGNILAYGEKTCQRKNSTLTKIHTRRMLIALKKDLNAVIKGFIFQPTMAENIYKIRSNVTTVMEKYKLGGGVASYNVSTDMNTTETLQQDLLYIAISCVPVGCIEQVEITFTLNKSAE